MNIEKIETFIKNKKNLDKSVIIEFSKKESIIGQFIQGKDYHELKEKNFWRIITNSDLDLFSKTKDITLARIVNGFNIVKLH